MASSNLAVLTKSHNIIAAKKRAKKEQIKEVVFDDDARREFLTGFHKRKVQKKEAAKKKAQEREKQERLEARREKRQLLAERAVQNAEETERAYGGYADEQDSETEWSGIVGAGSPDKGKRKEQEDEYEYEEQVATVTVVEDFDPDELIHGASHPRPTTGSDVAVQELYNSSRSKRAPPSGNALPGAKLKDKTAVDRNKLKAKTGAKVKDVKYQTNAARKADRMKQRRRKTEKAERAGGKASRKGGAERRKRR